jgi:xanthine dehydrogenase accessory factor
MDRPAPRLDTSLELLLPRLPQGAGEAVLGTVVATAGSTYRKPGARMLLFASGERAGLLSGGCLESDLGERARAVLNGGAPCVVDYDQRGADDELFGYGAGCEGAMRILLEPVSAESPARRALTHLAAASRAARPTAVVMVYGGPPALIGTHDPESRLPGVLQAAREEVLRERCSRRLAATVDGVALQAFVEYLAPPVHLLLCGAGPDAEPVCRTACALGWSVTVVDHRPALARAQRFPGARVLCAQAAELAATVDLAGCDAAVVMSHHLRSDAGYLGALAAAGPGYVGLLGPQARRARLLDELGARARGLHGRLRGPVGLDLGAATPEAIALAVVAEIHALLAACSGGPLSRLAP